MTPSVKEAVLNAIADHYESVELILHTIQLLDGLPASTKQVADALGELVVEGLAQTYELSSTPPHSKFVDFDAGRIEELWFYVTPRGRRLVQTGSHRSL